MALPPTCSVEQYFDEAVAFLKTYQWIYSSPNTHILVNKVLDQFPCEWLEFLKGLPNEEINNLAQASVGENAPQSLKLFFWQINRLKSVLENKPTDSFEFAHNSGLSRKKQHEILSLVPVIKEICDKSECDFIVDVGSGLGYLPRLLHSKYNYPVLGIEGSLEKLELAKKHQQYDAIEYWHHFVTKSSAKDIEKILEDKSGRACVTGLHACADLSVTVLELFLQIDALKSLVIMPCCYHRLSQTETGFENFPVSELLKKMVDKYEAEKFLNVAFLRLACQGSADRFSKMTKLEHEQHANNCLFRAILEDVVVSANDQVRRLKRKCGNKLNSRQHIDPFESYLANVKHTHSLVSGGEITNDQFLEKMREKWKQHKASTYRVEALAAFQAAMQNVCENLVLLDRVLFLREKGVECFVVKVTDQWISPRCHALVAVKP